MRELRKQDRTSSRLPTDTERKYKLGQIELTADEVEQLKSKLVVDEYLSITSSNAIANKTVANALNNKVTKEEGKTLSSNDFTDEYKTKVDNLAAGGSEEGTTVELIGTDGTPSNTNTYHANAINELAKEVYSAEEQIIGTWFGKPLYRKTLSKTITSNTSADLGSINNVDYINVKDGCTKFVSGVNTYYVPTSTYEASNNFSKFFVQKNTSTNVASIKWVGNSTTGTIYATVVYTKTTD